MEQSWGNRSIEAVDCNGEIYVTWFNIFSTILLIMFLFQCCVCSVVFVSHHPYKKVSAWYFFVFEILLRECSKYLASFPYRRNCSSSSFNLNSEVTARSLTASLFACSDWLTVKVAGKNLNDALEDWYQYPDPSSATCTPLIENSCNYPQCSETCPTPDFSSTSTGSHKSPRSP